MVMGKSSNFPRHKHDQYRTPAKAVIPLLPLLPAGTVFAEPCAGDGALVEILEGYGHRCVWATDIDPQSPHVSYDDALTIRNIGADMFITNPPWTKSILHPMIDHLSSMLPCWFLFDADWPHTKQSSKLIARCSRIVPIGRLKWIAGSAHAGLDNCCWYEFLPNHNIGPRFIGWSDDQLSLAL